VKVMVLYLEGTVKVTQNGIINVESGKFDKHFDM